MNNTAQDTSKAKIFPVLLPYQQQPVQAKPIQKSKTQVKKPQDPIKEKANPRDQIQKNNDETNQLLLEIQNLKFKNQQLLTLLTESDGLIQSLQKENKVLKHTIRNTQIRNGEYEDLVRENQELKSMSRNEVEIDLDLDLNTKSKMESILKSPKLLNKCEFDDVSPTRSNTDLKMHKDLPMPRASSRSDLSKPSSRSDLSKPITRSDLSKRSISRTELSKVTESPDQPRSAPIPYPHPLDDTQSPLPRPIPLPGKGLSGEMNSIGRFLDENDSFIQSIYKSKDSMSEIPEKKVLVLEPGEVAHALPSYERSSSVPKWTESPLNRAPSREGKSLGNGSQIFKQSTDFAPKITEPVTAALKTPADPEGVDESYISNSPSPTKSMLILERDELEKELLCQYGRLRKLESMEHLLNAYSNT